MNAVFIKCDDYLLRIGEGEIIFGTARAKLFFCTRMNHCALSVDKTVKTVHNYKQLHTAGPIINWGFSNLRQNEKRYACISILFWDIASSETGTG